MQGNNTAVGALSGVSQLEWDVPGVLASPSHGRLRAMSGAESKAPPASPGIQRRM